MTRRRTIVAAACIAAAACCASAALAGQAAAPKESARSCWTNASHLAPSAVPKSVAPQIAPDVRAQRVLARLGDTRFVKNIVLGPPPPITFQGRSDWRTPPPSDALWAYISAPQAGYPTRDSNGRPASVYVIANWEADLVRRALRDEFCAAGGPPLVGSTVSGMREMAKARGPYVQRFRNPLASLLRSRIAQAGERYGFRVVSLQLLRPLQVAPLLVVETDRDRKEFAADVGEILDSLHSGSYEGFYFEARDDDGPFLGVERLHRGPSEGGQWAAGCLFPFETLGGC